MLTVEKLNAFYGKKQVLFGVDLTLRDRSIAAVIGPNGAGKSTVLRSIFGLVRERQGRITFDGRDVSHLSPVHNIAAGLAFVPQGARVFRELTVQENLRMGGYTLPSAVLAQRRESALQAFPVLSERRTQKAGALSGGERQMLAFAMALMLRPRLLLIDEPSIGLAPKLVTQIFDTISAIREELGTSVLIVEQQAQQVLRVADTVFVIRAGELISHGPVENYRGEDVLRQVYLSNRTSQVN
ncbi:MAG: ABC transporter ATP-binding protein [Candidatus Lambdaproteobacteria bacterium]|nr:ABC transporter ATP-binding protein [Candidatus Lambdaproteobacteria bacterium]